MSFEDYLAAEQQAETKHEWVNGVVYAMGGGSVEHGRLATKVTAALTTKLAGQCTVFSSDVMVYVRETELATYPDGSVVCGSLELHRVERNGRVIGEAITNPALVIEVLSPSTESYDRGEKLAHYMRLPSLEAYVLVAQDQRRIEVFHRPTAGGKWPQAVAQTGESIVLHGASLEVDAIYDP